MLMTAIVLTAAFASGQPSAAPLEQRSEVRGRLTIPDEIGPAIAPYVRCKIASAGVELRSSIGGPVERPAAPVGADCSQVRAQAASQAERMLRQQGRGSAAERRALIERTLASVDGFIGATPPEAIPAQ